MPIAEPIDRRRALQAAIDAIKGERDPDRTMTNGEMYGVWGVSKGRWTDIRNQIPNFPAPVMKGNEQHYPALPALEAMWAYETRNDQVAAQKTKRMARLLGMDDFDHSMPSVTEMQKASALRADIEQRMFAQGELVAASDVQAVVSKIGELLSRRIGNLGTIIDPNGQLPVEARKNADEAGKTLLLLIHREMRDMLTRNANAQPKRSGGNGGGAGRPRKTASSAKRR